MLSWSLLDGGRGRLQWKVNIANNNNKNNSTLLLCFLDCYWMGGGARPTLSMCWPSQPSIFDRQSWPTIIVIIVLFVIIIVLVIIIIVVLFVISIVVMIVVLVNILNITSSSLWKNGCKIKVLPNQIMQIGLDAIMQHGDLCEAMYI